MENPKTVREEDLFDEEMRREAQRAENRPPNRAPFSIRDLLNGTFLAKTLLISHPPFVLLVSLCAVIYIGNSYHAQRVARDIDLMTRKVKELRTEALMTARDYMFMSRQTEILKAVRQRQLPLAESETPPVVIK